MKPWAWALGASLALHVGGAWLLASGSAAPAPPRLPAPAAKPTEAVFTRVSLTPRAGPALAAAPSKPPAGAPEPLRSPRAESRGAPSPGDEGLLAGASSPGGEEVLDSARTERGAPSPGDEEVLDSARTERGGASAGDGAGLDSAGPAQGGGASPGAPGPDLVALVHARLAAAAERCYPAAARRFQQRGTVELSFCIDARGAATDTAVTRSSGAALLDTAARGCVVESAAPFAPEASARCFTVPVRFGAR